MAYKLNSSLTHVVSVVDMTAFEVGRTEAVDWVFDVDIRRCKEGEHTQNIDSVLAVELVREAVGTTELCMMDVAEEVEQAIHVIYLCIHFGSFKTLLVYDTYHTGAGIRIAS
jgi:hypothetical protein